MSFFFMKIGLVSDSHDNLVFVKKAVEFFNEKEVEYVFHAGDYVAPFTVKEFLNLKARFIGVFGNNDGELNGIRALCDSIYTGPYTLDLTDKKITILHSIENLDRELEERSDVVVYGHTHEAKISESEALLINPGECGGWVNGVQTVGLLELDSMEVEIVKL